MDKETGRFDHWAKLRYLVARGIPFYGRVGERREEDRF